MMANVSPMVLFLHPVKALSYPIIQEKKRNGHDDH